MERKQYRRGGAGGPFRVTAGQIASLAVFVVVVVGVFWGLLTCFFTVEADEVGIVQHFGRYTGAPREPGLNWKLPFGIDRHSLVKVDKIETLEFGFETVSVSERGTRYREGSDEVRLMMSGDQNVVSVEWVVHYKIKDPASYLFKVKEPRETVHDLSQAVMSLVVGDSSATEVFTTRRAEAAQEAKDRLQEILDGYDAGIQIVTVELQDVRAPTKEVEDAFNEVNEAGQERERTILEANREYQKAIPQAEGEARRIVQEAEGFLLKRVNEARGDVALFEKLLVEYENSKEVTRRRLYLEAIEEVLPHLTRIYVVDDASSGPLQVLDLEKAAAGARRPAPSPETPSTRGGAR